MTKNKFPNFNFRLIGFWLVAIIVLDIVGGLIFIPRHVKETHKLRNLNADYNHGFNANAEAFQTFGTLKYKCYTNSMGMIDARIRTVNKEDKSKRRILVIGDSFTEGSGYQFPQTFCGQLKSMMDTNKVEILNAGVGSFSPKLYYLRVKSLLQQEHLKVDEVVCCIDYSDIGDELVYEDFKSKQGSGPPALCTFWKNNSLVYNVGSLIGLSMFCKTAGIKKDQGESFIYWAKTNDDFLTRYPDFWKIRSDWMDMDFESNHNLQHAIQLAFSNMTLLKNLCHENHMRLTVMVYPQSYALLKKSEAMKCSNLWQHYCATQSIPFISLYPVFIKDDQILNVENRQKYYIPGDSHWNAEGHKLVADTLCKYLNAHLPIEAN